MWWIERAGTTSLSCHHTLFVVLGQPDGGCICISLLQHRFDFHAAGSLDGSATQQSYNRLKSSP